MLVGLLLLAGAATAWNLLGNSGRMFAWAHLIGGITLLGLGLFSFIVHSAARKSGLPRRGDVTKSIEMFAKCAGCVCVGVLLNLLAIRNDVRMDLSATRRHSLSTQTSDLLARLSEPMELVYFDIPGRARVPGPSADGVLDLYRYASRRRVQTRIVDVLSQPQVAQQLGMQPGQVLYLAYGNGEGKRVARLAEVSEQSITSAILRLSEPKAARVYVLQGHDEPSPFDPGPFGLQSLTHSLEADGLLVEPLRLDENKEIPGNASAVLVVGTRLSLSPDELALLNQFARRGGGLLLATDPGITQGVAAVAINFGIQVLDAVAVDRQNEVLGRPETRFQVLTRQFSEHPSVRGFTDATPASFSMATPMLTIGVQMSGFQRLGIMKSSPETWAVRDVSGILSRGLMPNEPAEGDIHGPLVLAASWEGSIQDSFATQSTSVSLNRNDSGRVFVVGDTDFMRNSQIPFACNRDFALNAVHWVAHHDTGITAQRTSSISAVKSVTDATLNKVISATILLCELLVSVMLGVWLIRTEAPSPIEQQAR